MPILMAMNETEPESNPAATSGEASAVWIDVDNPPQVQYLVPVRSELVRRGYEVVLTARDNSITFALLRDLDVPFVPVGRSFGKQTVRKVLGVIGRAVRLMKAVRATRPRLVVAASRSAAMAARMMGIPCFVICDYEHAELKSYTWFGSYLVFPEVIPADVFRRKGFRADRLLTFPGIKENLTFHGKDLDAVAAWQAPEPQRVIVAFRPPASETHYYSAKSRTVYIALLEYLARRDDIFLLFLPRYRWQVDDLKELDWQSPWQAPDEPIPAIPLLKGVDLVISSGGTMLREACYLDVPAYSIFQSSIGEVDRYLEREGKLVLLSGPEDFSQLRFAKKQPFVSRASSRETMERLLEYVLNPDYSS